ncbi:hypothetical protein [Marinobacter nauticus]|uniref:hypothetical protein n=2 Tax=Marinobacter nauticus TaxID=2743 RepID=UPI003734DF4C
MTMEHYIELVRIDGDWEGGHHGQYPKVFGVSLESDKPFVVTEGSGWGLGGASYTLPGLFEGNAASIFDRAESSELFQVLSSAYHSGASDEVLVLELMQRYGGHA